MLKQIVCILEIDNARGLHMLRLMSLPYPFSQQQGGHALSTHLLLESQLS